MTDERKFITLADKLVFLVDDTDSILAMAASILEDDYLVLTMPSAEKMFALLTKKQPDIILLDIEMPDINGFDALAGLKENPDWRDIPVIFLTGYIDGAVLLRSLESGAHSVISKSDIDSTLLQRVKDCIG